MPGVPVSAGYAALRAGPCLGGRRGREGYDSGEEERPGVVSGGLPSRWLAGWEELHHRYGTDGEEPDPTDLLTVSVPHFGVLSVGSDPLTSASSPPTIVYGRHARALADLLGLAGIRAEEVMTFKEADAAATRKLIWSSAMWLLCHDAASKNEGDSDGGGEGGAGGVGGGEREPVDVVAVHETKPDELRSLVSELIPAAEALVVGGGGGSGSIGSVDDALAYMESYSRSMPGAVPSLALAVDEIGGRNGALLSERGAAPQPLHEDLIRRVAGEGALTRCLADTAPDGTSDSEAHGASDGGARAVLSPSSGLAFLARPDPRAPPGPVETGIVIGAGIVGSSVALSLARRGASVTVYDRRPIISGGDGDCGDVGEATSASWAWINSNGKFPPQYAGLNRLGMTCWRRDPVLRDLPVWCGSLVRRKREAGGVQPGQGGAYAAVGPLDEEGVRRLEPAAVFGDDGRSESEGAGEEEDEIFFYPDEGHVDPAAAVRALRRAAAELGVRFCGGTDICGLVADEDGRVVGVEHSPSPSPEGPSEGSGAKAPETASADVVVVAGGAGSSDPALGGLPMLDAPGVLAFARVPSPESPGGGGGGGTRLRRILVDTLAQSHVLQRAGGTLVAGGGVLQVGGSAATARDRERRPIGSAASEEDEEAGRRLLGAASRLAPDALRGAALAGVRRGMRPIPRDGYPAVGRPRWGGPYICATHSGVTLGPLLGELVAAEVVEGVRCEVLEVYRPGRLFEDGDVVK